MLNIAHGIENAGVYLNAYARKLDLPIDIPESTALSIVESVVLQLFNESNVFNQVRDFGLGDIPLHGKSFNLLLSYDQYKRNRISEIPPSIRGVQYNDLPFVQAFYAVKRMYENLQKTIGERDDTGVT